MKKVYVAGPYANGDVAVNVREAMSQADTLLRVGYAPYLPHLSHFWHLVYPHPHQTWLDLDKVWLLSCECMLRLPGHSPGAEQEEKWAEEAGIPVYYSIADLFAKETP